MPLHRLMTRKALTATGVLLAACALTGCSDAPLDEYPTATPSHTQCANTPELLDAVDTVWDAGNSASPTNVYGEGGGRLSNLFQLLEKKNLAAIANPNGAGVIVSVVSNDGKVGFRDAAVRTGWLVLDGEIYPTDVPGAQAFGLLDDGYPDGVKAEAGITDEESGFNPFGFDWFVSYNADTVGDYDEFMRAANSLCTTPTGLGV